MVEKDFSKLLNNSNFGIDCRNNIEKCILEPLFIIKFTIFGDDTFRLFFPPEQLREKAIQHFQWKLIALNKSDPTYKARKEYYENAIEEELDAIESFKNDKREKKRKFDHESTSIKSFVVKKEEVLK